MIFKREFLNLWLTVLFLCSGGFCELFAQTVSVEAISRPSADKILSFVRVGRIKKYFVSEGDIVKPGEVLVKLDDRAEALLAARLKAEAEDQIRVYAAKAKHEQKKVDLQRILQAKSKGVATDLEVDTAKLEVLIADAEHKLQKFNIEQALKKYQEAEIQVEQMSLFCPQERGDTKDTKYLIEQLMVRTGESVDPQTKVMRVVKIDPLWIDVPVSLIDLRNLDLKVNQSAKVFFPASTQPATGRVTFIASVADAASSTRTVRVEIPNSQVRPGGEYVRVEFVKGSPMLAPKVVAEADKLAEPVVEQKTEKVEEVKESPAAEGLKEIEEIEKAVATTQPATQPTTQPTTQPAE